MSLLGKTIWLSGLSQKGKNCIQRHGAGWSVLAETDQVLFSTKCKGTWLFIVPLDETMESKAARWIHYTADTDFRIN
jgi:hypothetical protein